MTTTNRRCAKCGFLVSLKSSKIANALKREGGGFDHVTCTYAGDAARLARGIEQREHQLATRQAVRRGEVYR